MGADANAGAAIDWLADKGTDMADDFEIVRATLTPATPALATFDYLIAHARAAAFLLVPRTSEVRSIELQWPDRRQNPFSAQTHPGHVNFYLRRPILNMYPGLFAAAERRFGAVKDNTRGEYRTHLSTIEEVDALLAFLRGQGAWPSHRHDRRFVASTFQAVTGEHLLRAAQRLIRGFSDHRFGPSTEYDLLFDGHRLPPKAVFGLAASDALGFPVGPENFSAGDNTLCFRMLRGHGYPIVAKGERDAPDPALISDEDRSWSEGRSRLVTHLRRERGTGLAAAKRDQFRQLHGRLFCERCGMDPVETFGSELGEACIEVHHRDTHVAEMGEGHETRLEDLQCLCANCHRVTHRELKALVIAGS